jgi:tetratricopeptide (TPR) repeat protein
MVSGPLAGRILHRFGYRAWGWIVGAGVGILGLGLDVGILLWRVEQYCTTLTLLLAHGICTGALYLGLKRPLKHGQQALKSAGRQRGALQNVFAGVVAGGLLSLLLGVAAVTLYMLASDRLLSTLMPVAFDDRVSLFMLFIALIPMMAAGLVLGGLLGWLRPLAGPAQILGYTLALIWVQLTWLAALQITIAVPGFQAGAATGEGWKAIVVPFTTGQLLVGIGWSIVVLLYVVQPMSLRLRYRRALVVPAINLCAAIALSIVLGYPADLFLSLGRHQERNAQIASSLWCYQQGLGKAPKPQIASYLQYRAALIHHKLGHRDKALNGFRCVVTKYNQRTELAQQANRFLDNMQNAAPDARRVVLDGVETRTQYTGAYCVPNSLALAMRYWGAPMDARSIGAQITGLGTGTYVVDQSWYAQAHDFRHDFLSMAGLADIKICIDAGFPVLVYVPAHVFAIVGYDEMLKTFVTYDVATQDLWAEYLQEDFIKAWKKQATTLVLAYPGEKADLLPASIRARLQRGSDNYLHFQLHHLANSANWPKVAHLERAAGEDASFFFPLTILYTDYPSLRASMDARYDVDQIVDAIVSYFSHNFDEGTHLAGQYHNERWANPDWALQYGVEYLIGQHRFEEIERLLARVDAHGQLSGQMQYYSAILALSQGRYEEGLDSFGRARGDGKHFYAALASLQMGDRSHALHDLVETLDGCL